MTAQMYHELLLEGLIRVHVHGDIRRDLKEMRANVLLHAVDLSFTRALC